MIELYLIRGLPGSGKASLAENIAKHVEDLRTVTVDDFFKYSNGHTEKYRFDRRFIGAAHDECYGRCMRALRNNHPVAVVGNFSTTREIERYTRGLTRTGLAKRVTFKVIKCIGEPKGVNSAVIDHLMNKWEDYDGEETFNGDYSA